MAAVVTVAALATCSPADARAPHVRLGVAPPRPAGAVTLGALPDTTELSVDIALKPQDGLAAYAQAVSTPGSPDYHHFLTVSEFRQRFGAPASTVSAVSSALRAQGLAPGPVSSNGLLISVNASAGELSQAFDTSFQRVQLPSGQVAYANNAAPSVASSAAPAVQAIVGLDTLTQEQPQDEMAEPLANAQTYTGSPGGSCSASVTEGSSSKGFWTPDEIASTYDFTPFYAAGDTGAGQTVALLEFESNLDSDITTYTACFGTNSPSVIYDQVDGGSVSDPDASGSTAEAALDIEQVLGFAPQAQVKVFQAPNTSTGTVDALTSMVDDPSVNIISTSWGACEPSVALWDSTSGSDEFAAENELFEQAATLGKSVFAAAGDDGSSDCYGSDPSNTAQAVDDPGSQPYVTSVGGTSLPDSNAVDQTVWNSGSSSGVVGAGAGGGGPSSVWRMQSYQASALSSLGIIGPDSLASCNSTYCREVPDVSADADPNTGYPAFWTEPDDPDNSDICRRRSGCAEWLTAGGTSVAAPLWAAYTALINASATCTAAHRSVGYANQALYAAADADYSAYFTDIVQGNNDYTGTGGGYPATTGYDMATGLGTPIGAPLAAYLCDPVSLQMPASQTTTVGTAAASVTLNAADAEGGAVAVTVHGLPRGLQQSGDTISGTPTVVGAYTVSVTATATATGAVAQGSFIWNVTSPPVTPPAPATPAPTVTVSTPATPPSTVSAPATPPSTVSAPTTPIVTTPKTTVVKKAPTTKTLVSHVGNQTLTLTTPLPTRCTAAKKKLTVSFKSATGKRGTKLRLKSAEFYIGKGVAHTAERTEVVHGKKKRLKVTTYKPNATTARSSVSEKLALKGLKRGKHPLKVVITYTENVKQGKKTVTKAVTSRMNTTFRVC